MYLCKRCNKSFQDENTIGVEVIFGKAYCVSCGEQLVKMDGEHSSVAERIRRHAIPTMVTNSDHSVSSTSNSNNTTITNIYKGDAAEKVETRYGVFKQNEVSLCKSCKEYVPQNYFISEAGICQDCMLNIQIAEGDGAFEEGLFEEARDCYEKVLKTTYGNEERRYELMFKLGRCYIELQDGKRAVGYFAKTKNKFADSIYYLGLCSEIGLGKEKNAELAMKYYNEAAKKGSSLAIEVLAKKELESIENERLMLEEEERADLEEEITEGIASDILEEPNDEVSISVGEPEVPNDEESSEEVNPGEPDNVDIQETDDEENIEEDLDVEPEIPQQEFQDYAQETVVCVHPIADSVQTQKRLIEQLKKYKWTLIGAGIVILLIASCYIIGNNKREDVRLFLNTDQKTIVVGQDDTLSLTSYPKDVDISVKWESSDTHIATVQDGIVTAHSEGNVVIRVYSTTDNEVSAQCHYLIQHSEVRKVEQNEKAEVRKDKEKTQKQKPPVTSPKVSSSRTLDLGYANYSGDIRNGKPDGAGVLTFKRHYMVGRDFSGEEVYAEQGERLDGNFSNGYLQVGTLYQKDGNTKKIRY